MNHFFQTGKKMMKRNFSIKRMLAGIVLFALLVTMPSIPVQGGQWEQASPPESASEGATPETPPAPQERGTGLYMPEDFTVQATAAYLINEETGVVLYAKNEDEPLVMASLVKMMTCILTVENVKDLDGETVVADKSWIFDELFGKNASTADIRPGETLTIRELLYGMLLPSANEAALLAADYVSGGYMKNFIYMMNTRAAALGCTNTVFVDANGLSEENKTTAKDMYLIARAFMSYPVLVEIAATPTYEMAAHEKHPAPYYIQTTDKLIAPNSAYYTAYKNVSGLVKAGKTGSLGVWQNFASMAQKPGETYYCVVLNSPNEADTLGASLDVPQARPALFETAQLYNWAFGNFTQQGVLDVTQPITEVKVKYSTDTDVVRLLPANDLRTVLQKDADESVILKTFTVPDFVEAPIQQGDVVGVVTLFLAGQEIGRADLIAAESVERNNTLYTVTKIQEFFSFGLFKVLLALGVVAIGGYALLVVWASNQRKKHKYAGRPTNGKGRKR